MAGFGIMCTCAEMGFGADATGYANGYIEKTAYGIYDYIYVLVFNL